MHVCADIQSNTELVAQVLSDVGEVRRARDRDWRSVLIEYREASIAHEFDDSATAGLDECCCRDIEAMDELSELDRRKWTDCSAKPGQVCDHDHAATLNARRSILRCASHGAPPLFIASLLRG
jgi:hypothetical protein